MGIKTRAWGFLTFSEMEIVFKLHISKKDFLLWQNTLNHIFMFNVDHTLGVVKK